MRGLLPNIHLFGVQSEVLTLSFKLAATMAFGNFMSALPCSWNSSINLTAVNLNARV